ncbi:MAG TPA: MlaD family protein [Tepidisphaeraceae bacterium]|nr:MlaD family protein [Tepidisphaeraceae bacterium]
MAPMRKNLAVGATVLVALLLLGGMILRFGDAPVKWFRSANNMPIVFSAESADGISNGSPISYRGVVVGKVESVGLDPDGTAVLVRGTIDERQKVPANVEGTVRSSLIGGSASIGLVPAEPPSPTASAKGLLQPNTTVYLRGGSGLPTREIADLSKRLMSLTERLEVTIKDLNESGVVKKIAGTVDAIRETVTKAGATLDATNKLIGDPKVTGDLTQTLANFREVSENAKSITKNLDKLTAETTVTVQTTNKRIDEISKSLGDRLAQAATALERFNSIAAKVDKGEGTAGKLINDPRLYESLAETSAELNLTIKDLRRLVEQWEQEGVSLKLGGKK